MSKFVCWPRALSLAALGTLVCLPVSAFAQNTPALDTTNFDVDIAGYVPLVAGVFAGLIAAVLSVYFLIQITRGGLKWIRSYAAK